MKHSRYAANNGPRVLEFFENYFQIDYPLTKEDFASIPNIPPGAMENWGLIIAGYMFRDSLKIHSSLRLF